MKLLSLAARCAVRAGSDLEALEKRKGSKGVRLQQSELVVSQLLSVQGHQL